MNHGTTAGLGGAEGHISALCQAHWAGGTFVLERRSLVQRDIGNWKSSPCVAPAPAPPLSIPPFTRKDVWLTLNLYNHVALTLGNNERSTYPINSHRGGLHGVPQKQMPSEKIQMPCLQLLWWLSTPWLTWNHRVQVSGKGSVGKKPNLLCVHLGSRVSRCSLVRLSLPGPGGKW